MRDPERMKPLLDRLEELWRKYPDMRLSQLIINCASTQRDIEPSVLWHMEDDVLLEGIRALERTVK